MFSRHLTFIIGCFLMTYVGLYGQISSRPISKETFYKTEDLKSCLWDCYHVEAEETRLIVSKLAPLLENEKYHDVISDFITKSKAQNISLNSSRADFLKADDAVLKAPDWHEVLFESPYVRILWGVTKPSEREPFHTHYWKRLMIIIQGALFEIENTDGSLESGEWPIGVYELPAETQASAYTNIGTTEFHTLIFEIKE